MKLGYTYCFCGIGLILTGIAMIIMLFVDSSGAPIGYAIGRIIFSFISGLSLMMIGARKIAKARLEQQMNQLRQITDFLDKKIDGEK